MGGPTPSFASETVAAPQAPPPAPVGGPGGLGWVADQGRSILALFGGRYFYYFRPFSEGGNFIIFGRFRRAVFLLFLATFTVFGVAVILLFSAVLAVFRGRYFYLFIYLFPAILLPAAVDQFGAGVGACASGAVTKKKAPWQWPFHLWQRAPLRWF